VTQKWEAKSHLYRNWRESWVPMVHLHHVLFIIRTRIHSNAMRFFSWFYTCDTHTNITNPNTSQKQNKTSNKQKYSNIAMFSCERNPCGNTLKSQKPYITFFFLLCVEFEDNRRDVWVNSEFWTQFVVVSSVVANDMCLQNSRKLESLTVCHFDSKIKCIGCEGVIWGCTMDI